MIPITLRSSFSVECGWPELDLAKWHKTNFEFADFDAANDKALWFIKHNHGVNRARVVETKKTVVACHYRPAP